MHWPARVLSKPLKKRQRAEPIYLSASAADASIRHAPHLFSLFFLVFSAYLLPSTVGTGIRFGRLPQSESAAIWEQCHFLALVFDLYPPGAVGNV